MSGAKAQKTVIAIDPGRDKCGVAVVAGRGELLDKYVVRTPSIIGALKQSLQQYPQSSLVIGDGTGSEQIQASIASELPDLALHIISERYTSERALELWRDEESARGWRRLLPRSLRFPGEPLDDFAAWILAQDYLETSDVAGSNDPR